MLRSMRELCMALLTCKPARTVAAAMQATSQVELAPVVVVVAAVVVMVVVVVAMQGEELQAVAGVGEMAVMMVMMMMTTTAAAVTRVMMTRRTTTTMKTRMRVWARRAPAEHTATTPWGSRVLLLLLLWLLVAR